MINLVKFDTPLPINVLEPFLSDPSYEVREETGTIIIDYFDTCLDVKVDENSQIIEVFCFDEYLCSEENLLGFAYAVLPEKDFAITAVDSLGTSYNFDKNALEEYLEEF